MNPEVYACYEDNKKCAWENMGQIMRHSEVNKQIQRLIIVLILWYFLIYTVNIAPPALSLNEYNQQKG